MQNPQNFVHDTRIDQVHENRYNEEDSRHRSVDPVYLGGPHAGMILRNTFRAKLVRIPVEVGNITG